MNLIKNNVFLVNGELIEADEAGLKLLNEKGVNAQDVSLRDNTLGFRIMNKHNTSGDTGKERDYRISDPEFSPQGKR